MSASADTMRAGSRSLVDVVGIAPPAHPGPDAHEVLVQERRHRLNQHQRDSLEARGRWAAMGYRAVARELLVGEPAGRSGLVRNLGQ